MANLQTLSPSELAKLPLSVLNALPALPPPVGVESNFVNPEDRGYVLNSVATVLFCLMVCFFANRVYTRLFIIRKMGWDDCNVVHAWICTILGPVGKHQWDVRLVDFLGGNFVIMLHYHLPALEKFRSMLSTRFASLRSTKSGDMTGGYGVSQSNGPIHHPVKKSNPGPYSDLEVEAPSPGGATFQPTYELGQLQSVQTFIGKGWKKRASDDKIHLTHEIQQQQANSH
ncbi:MAG: hypothetical protein Q9175_004359 [Cornicularia normoerica]